MKNRYAKKEIDQQSRRYEKAAGHTRHEAYCPRCGVWYPSNSSAHAGH